MERPLILHMFTPERRVSPFDVNMAADAGWQLVVPYGDVGLDDVAALTQDTIFSRGPKGAARSAIFIGGRDVALAADMADRARGAMMPPFAVSTITDPSGACTTAAAMVACVEAALARDGGAGLRGRRVVVLGGTGPVGRVAAVLAAQAGADVAISSRQGVDGATKAARATGERFGVALSGVAAGDAAALRAAIADADVLLACAAAGVEVVGAEDLPFAKRLKVAADINAVPPAGIAGVGATDDAKPLAGTGAVAIGALAIGNVKYQTQHRLLERMAQGGGAQHIGFAEAHAMARELVTAKAA
jgi:methylene-tetrahydromethanopterin dehydrogenase